MSKIIDGALEAFNAKDLKDAGDYVIKVLSGPHEGVRLIKKPGTLTIGAGSDNDIVLFAGDAEADHVEFDLPSGLFDNIKMTPVDGAVRLQDGSNVEVGQYTNLESGEHLNLGNTRVEISRIAEPRSMLKPALRILAIIALFAMIPFAYNLMSGMAVGVADASSRMINLVGTQISTQSERYIGLKASPERETAKAFNWNVRAKLEDLKLNHRVRATATSDGSIRVYGDISDKEVGRWNDFLRWYDGTSGYPALIRDVSRSTIDKNLPQVKSVWLNGTPTVFFKNGNTAGIGAKIANGWTVVGITAQGVTLERDGARVSLTY